MKSESQHAWSSALKSLWGFDALRPHQVGPVDALCAGRDVLAVLPTGGGKSLCYQLPGLVRGGVTLVVSPLIALMQDQAKDLKSRGIRVWNMGGLRSQQELNDVLDNAERSQPCFLFASPERLENPWVMERLSNLNIKTVAVDEAHCISEWGHDFRPSYRRIERLRNRLPHAAWGAFTATATPEVARDIRQQLDLNDPALFRHSSRRENLAFSVCHSRDPEAMLIKAAQNASGCGIIYAGTRHQTEKWAHRLRQVTTRVAAYHAGLSKEERKQILDDWLRGKTRIVVCTNAFGMGIDKPDVRWVFHAALPANLESYIQEAGRAGRDGNPSECVLFTNERAIQIQDERIQNANPITLPTQEVYQAIANQGAVAIGGKPKSTTSFDVHSIAKKIGVSISEINRCLQLLQHADYFGAIKAESKGALLIAFTAQAQTDLLEIDSLDNRTKRLVQHLSTLAKNGQASLDLAKAEASGFHEAHILETLNRLQTWGILHFRRWNQMKSIEWKRPCQAASDVVIPTVLTQRSYERSLAGWASFEGYLKMNECRQLYVSDHFGFEDEARCHSCDNCRIHSLNSDAGLQEWIATIPHEGLQIDYVLNSLPASRYAVFFEGMKKALESAEIWMEGQRIFKA